MHSNALCATPCGLPEETASLPALQRVPERCGADRWWRLRSVWASLACFLRSLGAGRRHGRAASAVRAAAIFRWRSGAWRSALDVLGRRIQKILKTCFALIHGARRRRLCFLMRITASLSNHQRNQPCSTAPAPRGLRTPLRAARFAACDAYQKPAAARQIYHGRKRDDVAEMHLERAAAVPGRRRGALRAR